jgi:hypothetical protein
MGAVRAMAPAPPPCPLLHPSGDAGLDLHVRMRLAVMFAGGAFGVVEVDSGFRLRLGVAPPQVTGAGTAAAGGLGRGGGRTIMRTCSIRGVCFRPRRSRLASPLLVWHQDMGLARASLPSSPSCIFPPRKPDRL